MGTNLSGTNFTGKLASNDIGTTVYATSVVSSNNITLSTSSDDAVSILWTRDLYVIFENAALAGNNNGNSATVRPTLTNLSYYDVFEDNSKNANDNMLSSYQATIAGDLDLTSIVTIQ